MNVLIIGASGGIGKALVSALGQGYNVDTLSRSQDGFDLCDEASIKAHSERLHGRYTMIICATGALEIDDDGPEKTIRAVTAEKMHQQFAVNAIGPALVLKHFHKALIKSEKSVFAVLSARVGSIEDNRLGGWISYRAAKAALNQIIRTSAIEISRTHPDSVCVGIHPGTVQTPLTQKYVGDHPSVTPQDAARNILAVLSDLDCSNTGNLYDWAGKRIPF